MNAPINKDLIAANSDRCAQPPSERVEALKKGSPERNQWRLY